MYKELAAEIVKRAVLDYEDALKHNYESDIFLLERFFRSEWFDLLSDCDGEVLMRMVRRKIHEEVS